MEKLDLDEVDGASPGTFDRTSFRRSFRRNYDSLRRKMTKRHQSTDRLVKRRNDYGNEGDGVTNGGYAVPGNIGACYGASSGNARLSAPNASTTSKRSSNISTKSSNRVPSLSSKSTDSILDIQNDWGDSRPCSGASYDLLSNCRSNIIEHDNSLISKVSH